MIEYLALPAWNTTPTSLDAWAATFDALGHKPTVAREGSGVAWIEIAPLRLRGYAVLEGRHVEAINFELHDPESAPATALIESAANALGWEIHPDDGDSDDDDES